MQILSLGWSAAAVTNFVQGVSVFAYSLQALVVAHYQATVPEQSLQRVLLRRVVLPTDGDFCAVKALLDTEYVHYANQPPAVHCCAAFAACSAYCNKLCLLSQHIRYTLPAA
jgi:hypothetical protein